MRHDRAFQRTGAVDRIEAAFHEQAQRVVAHVEANLVVGQPRFERTNVNPRNLADLGLAKRMEDHHVVDAIDELRSEVLRHDTHHSLFHHLVLIGPREGLNEVGSQVRCHHEDGIPEVDSPTVAVCQTPIIEHLQEHVEYVRMGLLNLVEQHDGVWAAPHSFGQIATFLVADITGRCANQPRHRVFLHELRHVDSHEGVLGVEHETGQCLAKFGLADAGWPEKHEGAVRAIRVADTRPRAAHGIGDGGDRLLLPNDLLVQLRFQDEQLLFLALHHFGDRNPRPPGHNLGNLFVRDTVTQQTHVVRVSGVGGFQLLLERREFAVLNLRQARQISGPSLCLHLLAQHIDRFLDVLRALQCRLLCGPDLVQVGKLAFALFDRLFERGQTRARGIVVLVPECLAFDLELNQAAFETVHFLGFGVHLHADQTRGFVHEVDGLVRQLTIGDVALRESCRSDDGRVSDVHAVMNLVAFLQPAEDGDGVLDTRLFDQHLLETALEGRVFLQVLTILIQRRCADAMQLAPGERGFQHVAGVHRPFCFARSHHGVDFIDEEDDVALFLGEFGQHGFQPFLELTPELRTRNERTHVKRENALVAQSFRNFTVDDPLGEAVDDRGLANSGLTNQHRIVLRPALQDLNRAPDLIVAADDRVELLLLCTLRQIDRVLGERAALFF